MDDENSSDETIFWFQYPIRAHTVPTSVTDDSKILIMITPICIAPSAMIALIQPLLIAGRAIQRSNPDVARTLLEKRRVTQYAASVIAQVSTDDRDFSGAREVVADCAPAVVVKYFDATFPTG